MKAKLADACSLLASALVTGAAAAQDAPCIFNCSSDDVPIVSDAIYCAGSDPAAGIAACTRLIEAAAQAGDSGALANAYANRAKHHVLRSEPDLAHADIDEALVHVAALAASAAPGPAAFEPNDTQAQAKPLAPFGFGIVGYTPMPAHLTVGAAFHDATDTRDWYVIAPRDSGLSGTSSLYPEYCPSPQLQVRDRLEISIDAMGSGGSYELIVNGGGGPQPNMGEYVMQLGTSLPMSTSSVQSEPIAVDLIGQACLVNARALWLEVRRAESASAAAEPYTLELSFGRVPNEPVISGIAPLSGPVGTAVTITGSDLQPFVEFNGVRAATTAVSATSITATVPSTATTGPIRTSDVMGASDSSEQIFTVTSQAEEPSLRPPGRSAGSSAGSLPTARDTGCCRVVPNAMQGRLGRVIVEFPEGAAGSTRVVLLKEGKELQSGYGSQSWDVLPGTYEIAISGKSVPNVTVQPRYDTSVRVGVLRIAASGPTRVAVLDAGKELTTGYGEQVIGLPIGSFALQIAGQTEPVTINEGQITDF